MANQAKRNYIFYAVMLVVFGALLWAVIDLGNAYDVRTLLPGLGADGWTSPWSLFRTGLSEQMTHPVPMLLLQIIAILIAVRFFSFLFKYLGQPGVIGEIVAGIALGPSVLGHFFPGTFQFLFSPETLVPLNIISQIGLVLFMFVIGMELDLGVIRKKASETLVISHASIIVPFFMGVVLAYFVYPEFGAGHTTFLPFALFIGISISITAFPVLARIIQERDLTRTPMGRLAIASAANNDVTAWCMLAAIIAIAKAGSMLSAVYTIGCAIVYVLFMFGVIRPFMRKIGNLYNNPEVINKTFVSFIFLVLIVSSYITEVLGIHALFGAFVAGVIMPDNLSFRRLITEKVEDVALVLFLPLFFVFTGLRTELGLLNTPELWIMCGVFIAVSIAGKMLGATFSARFVGESWKNSLEIGVLMNTRGLMELIVLNIGYEMGIIPSSIFVIFVIMALFTTFMATPSLMVIEKLYGRRKKKLRPQSRHNRILVSFGNPASGRTFLDLLSQLCGANIRNAKVTAVHYTIGTDLSPLNTGEFTADSFADLQDEARRLGLRVDERHYVTDHYTKDLADLARNETYDFVLMGAGPSFIREYVRPSRRRLVLNSELQRINELISRRAWTLPGALTVDKTRILFHDITSTLGVFVNRGFSRIGRIGILLGEGDSSLLRFGETIDPDTPIDLMISDADALPRYQAELAALPALVPGRVTLSGPDTPLADFVRDKQLLIVSYANWLRLARNTAGQIDCFPSFLVVKPADQGRGK
ncbi:MAG: cation:proton antiporter [Rikenellaceae bacterium]|nr:cation:proton antiporter [Rikenellaceae bacterium]